MYVYNSCKNLKKKCTHLMRNCEKEAAWYCSRARPLIAAAPVSLFVFVGESERARGRARKRARERARERAKERKRLKKGERKGNGSRLRLLKGTPPYRRCPCVLGCVCGSERESKR